MNPGVALLTERERECLRLLLHPLRAKGIAARLGLSVNTVNEHLRSARGKLGTTDSISAAHILREVEATHPQSLVPTESGYAGASPAANSPASEREDPVGGFGLPLATRGRPWNTLTLGQRLLWPLLIAFAAVMAAGVFVAGMAALSQVALELTR